MVVKKGVGVKKRTLKRKITKWYHMADVSGKVRLVGLVPAKKLTPVGKARKKIITGKLKRK